MRSETEWLLQQELRSRRMARAPYRAVLWAMVAVLFAPLIVGLLVAGFVVLCRSVGIH